MKRLILGLILAIGLSGCGSTLTTFNPSVASDIEKSLTVAHIAYNSTGELILTVGGTGQIKGQTAANIQTVYNKAGDALGAADKLNAAGQTENVLSQVNLANQALADVTKLVNGK